MVTKAISYRGRLWQALYFATRTPYSPCGGT